MNDGSFFEPLQVVYHDTMDNFAEVSKLNVERYKLLHHQQSSLLQEFGSAVQLGSEALPPLTSIQKKRHIYIKNFFTFFFWVPSGDHCNRNINFYHHSLKQPI